MGDGFQAPQQARRMKMMNISLPKRHYGGYIFDCDGTLADTMPLHYRAWARAVQESGGVFPEELFYSWGGRPSAIIVEDLNRKFGSSFDVGDMVERKENYYLDLIHEVQPLPAVVNVARELFGKAPLAVASGGFRKYVEITLAAIGIKNLFEVIVCAEDYNLGKPDPEPFLVAARSMGIAAGECLVFEDSPAGIEAAKRAGMDWIQIPIAAHLDPQL